MVISNADALGATDLACFGWNSDNSVQSAEEPGGAHGLHLIARKAAVAALCHLWLACSMSSLLDAMNPAKWIQASAVPRLAGAALEDNLEGSTEGCQPPAG